MSVSLIGNIAKVSISLWIDEFSTLRNVKGYTKMNGMESYA